MFKEMIGKGWLDTGKKLTFQSDLYHPVAVYKDFKIYVQTVF